MKKEKKNSNHETMRWNGIIEYSEAVRVIQYVSGTRPSNRKSRQT